MTVFAIELDRPTTADNDPAFESLPMSNGDTVAVGTGVSITASGAMSPAMAFFGQHQTVIVGGTVKAFGAGSSALAFFAGNAFFNPADPQAIVHTVVIAQGAEVSGGMQSTARIRLDPGQIHALDLLNQGAISGSVAVEGADYDDRIVSTGILSGNVSLFGGNDILKLSNDIGPMAASLGDGDDTVVVSSPSSLAGPISFDLGEGNDSFESSHSFGSVSGGTGDDTIRIGANGGGSYMGDDGSDLIVAGSGGDLMFGGNGTDTLSYALAGSGVGVDFALSLASGGAAADTILGFEDLVGSAFADTLGGDAGANRLDGGKGSDILLGRTGNDTYLVDSSGDVVSEAGGGGSDTVLVAASSFVMTFGIETAIVTRATGATVKGTTAADVIAGDVGADRLYGKAGLDTLTGGAGKDAFVFDTKPVKGQADKLKDFSVKDDTLWVDNAVFKGLKAGALKKDAFFLGSSAHDATDRFGYSSKTGIVSYDADGSGKAASIAVAQLAKALKLTYQDFFVI